MLLRRCVACHGSAEPSGGLDVSSAAGLQAGGGVRQGMAYGATDDFGFAAVENRVHVHDPHATILHLLGLDHTRLTYFHAGRDERPTDVHGRVIDDMLV